VRMHGDAVQLGEGDKNALQSGVKRKGGGEGKVDEGG
jgi:hypothetical protein